MPTRFQTRAFTNRALIHRLITIKAKNHHPTGFTLIELLIVVIILGVLSAIAIPSFLNQQSKARARAAETTVMGLARACAALQVTGETANAPAAPTGVSGSCTAAGTATTFTYTTLPSGVTRAPIASIASDGGVTLSQTAQP